MQVCLEDSGFVVLHEDDGTWGIEIQPNDPTSSQFALEAVSDCREQLGPPEPAPLADHEFHLLYADRLKQAECLRDMGIEISVAPSESRYVEIYRRSLEGGTEMPWEPLAEVPDGLLDSAMEVCPQTPLEDLH